MSKQVFSVIDINLDTQQFIIIKFFKLLFYLFIYLNWQLMCQYWIY